MNPTDAVAAVVHPDPYPYYARLVAARPFERDERLGLWVAASGEAVAAVLASPSCRVRPPAEKVPASLAGRPAGAVFGRLLRMSDGTAHVRLRSVVAGAATELDAGAIAAAAGAEARHRLAEAGAAFAGADLDALAVEMPMTVVAGQLGVPDVERAAVVVAAIDFVRGVAPDASPAAIARADAAIPALATALEGALPEAASLGAETRVANAIGLLMQTCDATAGLIGNGMRILARNPNHRRRLATDPDAGNAFVREVTRFDPPVQNTRRFVAEDAMIGGRRLKAGDAILVLLAAANRDPAENPDPHRFDPGRERTRCFGFGAGAHACPGASVARAIAAAALTELARHDGPFVAAAGPVGYRKLSNARIPVFAGSSATDPGGRNA